MEAKPTQFGVERRKLNFIEDTNTEKTLTIPQNRILVDQFHSKTTEKYNDIDMKSSSMAKSQKSFCGIKESLGSLIFETPPKGRTSFKFESQNNNFFSRLIISPNTPIGEVEEEQKEEKEVEQVYVSPSKFFGREYEEE